MECASDSKEQDNSFTNRASPETSLASIEPHSSPKEDSNTKEVSPQPKGAENQDTVTKEQAAGPQVMDTPVKPEETTYQSATNSEDKHQVITKVCELDADVENTYQLITDSSQLHEEPLSTHKADAEDIVLQRDDLPCQLITDSSQIEGDRTCSGVGTEVSQPEARSQHNKRASQHAMPCTGSSHETEDLKAPPDLTAYQAITEISQLRAETQPSDSTHQVITDSQTEEVELSPSDSNEHQAGPQLKRRQISVNDLKYTNQHKYPWHYKVLWILMIMVIIYNVSVWYNREPIEEMHERMMFEESARARNAEKQLKDTILQVENRANKIEKELKGASNHSTVLEEALSDTEWHLEDLQRKASGNDFAIQNLKYDLDKDVKIRLTDLEVKSEAVKQSLQRLDAEVQGMGATVEQMKVDITELKSGFTKYIDDTVKKALKFFFPQKLTENGYQGR